MPRLPKQMLTKHLLLRTPESRDGPVIFQAYTQDADVCRYMVWRPHASEATTCEFIASCIDAWNGDDRRPYVIAERTTNVAIGMIEARIVGTTVDIGYVLAKRCWGQGFMVEAITALAHASLDNPEIYRVQASCDVENMPSQRVLEKSDFVREARLERYTVHPNLSPEPRACFMFAKCR